MDKICKKIEKKYPCRKEIISTLSKLVAIPGEVFPAAIYLYGHSGTCKTAIVKEYLKQCSLRFKGLRTVHINCVECYTIKILLENVLEELIPCINRGKQVRCENLKEFVEELRQLHHLNTADTPNGLIIALDDAERLRDMDANLLPSLLRLQQLSGLNVCVILISQLPFEKYYCKIGFSEVLTIHCTQYTKAETLRILSADFENVQRVVCARFKRSSEEEGQNEARKLKLDSITPEFFNNYLNLFLSVFYKACRDVPELKITARKCFIVYIEPVLDGSIDAADVSRLWRHIAGPLKTALSQVYLRFDNNSQEIALNTNDNAIMPDQTVRKLAQSLELPYYGKYLLIAAFLASYNSAKEDKRLFVKHHGKQRKRMQTVNAKAKMTEKMSTSIGPKSFTIDRLLAIFYAILEEKVGLTCNLLSQISTLVHLKLLGFVSGENNLVDGSSRLQCTVGLEFVTTIGKVVGFNVRQYLCDFM